MESTIFRSYYLLNFIFIYVASTSNASMYHSNGQFIEWKNISVNFKDRKILSIGPGCLYPGRLLGVLGPSGCGKTTFLQVLSGRVKSTRGLKVYCDLDSDFRKTSQYVAFVNQLDCHFSTLTVMETLIFAASLKLSHLSVDERREKVKFVLNELNLEHIARNRVGDENIRGISGGEKKRLSVACELLSDPLLLLADEPTSGLDSFQAQQVVRILKEVSKINNIVTGCTIHQPGSFIWSMLDDVMLLTSKGRLAYLGPRKDALTHFAKLGYSCPDQTNPAEYLIDLISHNTSSPEASRISLERANFLADNFHFVPLKSMSGRTLSAFDRSNLKGSNVIRRRGLLGKVAGGVRQSLRHCYLLSERVIRQILRDGKSNGARVMVSGLLAMFIGFTFGPAAGAGSSTVSEAVTVIAHAAINIALLSSFKALETFKRERDVVERERTQSLYSSSEYLLSKSLIELPFDGIISGFFALVLHKITGLRSDLKTFVSISALLGISFSSMGLAIGALFPTGSVALSVGSALNVIYVITGAIGPGGAGKALPNSMDFLRSANPIRWGCEALIASEFCREDLSLESLRPQRIGWKGKIEGFVEIAQIVAAALVGRIKKILHPNKLETVSVTTATITAGEKVLEALGIKGASVAKGVTALVTLLVCHCLTGLFGLVVMKPKYHKSTTSLSSTPSTLLPPSSDNESHNNGANSNEK